METANRQNDTIKIAYSLIQREYAVFAFSFIHKQQSCLRKHFDLLRKVDDYRTYVRLRIDFVCLCRPPALVGAHEPRLVGAD